MIVKIVIKKNKYGDYDVVYTFTPSFVNKHPRDRDIRGCADFCQQAK
jgi:hypothetical protein